LAFPPEPVFCEDDRLERPLETPADHYPMILEAARGSPLFRIPLLCDARAFFLVSPIGDSPRPWGRRTLSQPEGHLSLPQGTGCSPPQRSSSRTTFELRVLLWRWFLSRLFSFATSEKWDRDPWTLCGVDQFSQGLTAPTDSHEFLKNVPESGQINRSRLRMSP